MTKDLINKSKMQATNEKHLALCLAGKRLTSEILNKSYKSMKRRQLHRKTIA